MLTRGMEAGNRPGRTGGVARPRTGCPGRTDRSGPRPVAAGVVAAGRPRDRGRARWFARPGPDSLTVMTELSRRAKALLVLAALAAVAAAAWLLAGRAGPPDGRTPVEEVGPTAADAPGDGPPEGEAAGAAIDLAATDPRVRVVSPEPGAVVSSPLTVRGRARGPWYFEGSFPVRLVNDAGRRLAGGTARARGAWTTADFVPFEATLSAPWPSGGTGLLVLERANPSGLAENAGRAVVPVRFDEAAPRRKAVLAFFNRPAGGRHDCRAVWPVARGVEPGRETARAALDELLEGPTPAERDRGFLTNLPSGVGVRSLAVKRGTARVDFDEGLRRVAGSCRVRAVRAQVERTLEQVPSVETVVISVEGDEATALQP